MTPSEAMEALNGTLAHAWMVRTFLKHAEEIQEDEEMLEIPRHDFRLYSGPGTGVSAKDAAEYLHRAKGKLPKLRKVAERLAQEHKRVSDHTNYQMAAASLTPASGGSRKCWPPFSRLQPKRLSGLVFAALPHWPAV